MRHLSITLVRLPLRCDGHMKICTLTQLRLSAIRDWCSCRNGGLQGVDLQEASCLQVGRSAFRTRESHLFDLGRWTEAYLVG